MQFYFEMNQVLPNDDKNKGGLYLGGIVPAKNVELLK